LTPTGDNVYSKFITALFYSLSSLYDVIPRMSRGQYLPRNQSARRVLERCRTRSNIEIIDVDKEKIDLVIDVEETSHLGSRGSGTTRRNGCPNGVISIDDEDESTDDSIRNVHSDAARKDFCPASSNSLMSEESKSNECPMTSRKEIPPFRSTQYVKKCHDVGPSVNRFGLSESSESCSSESDSNEFDSERINSDSDSSDCEIMEDSSGNIREQWERAALKKKMSDRVQFGSDVQASASGSSADAGLFSEEPTYCKIDIDNCINKVCSNYSEEIPADTYTKNPSYEKENTSFNIPADNGLHHSFQKKNADSTDLATNEKNADSTDLGTNDATNIGHKEPEHTSETCSHRAQSTYETLSDNLRFGFRDPETVHCTSMCDLNMQHDPKIKDDDVRDLDKDEQVPLATTSGTAGLHGESSIWGKMGPCPGQSSPPNPRSSPDNNIQDKKKHLPGEPSLSMQPQSDSVASPETACLQRKDESSCDKSSSWNYQCPDSSPLNVDCGPPCNTNGGSGATARIIASDTRHHDIPQVHTGFICERERHKESDEYRRAVEEEWAARQRQLQIQVCMF